MVCAVQEISLSYYSGHFGLYHLCLLQQLFQMFRICNFGVFFHKPLLLVAHVMFLKSKQHRKKLLPLAGLRLNKKLF